MSKGFSSNHFGCFFRKTTAFFYLIVVKKFQTRRLKAENPEIVNFQKIKFLATSVAFLGNKRNTCCRCHLREVPYLGPQNAWKSVFFDFPTRNTIWAQMCLIGL